MQLIPHAARGALANLLVPRRLFASRLQVTRVEVRVPDLPDELDGFSIAQVSDIHVGEARHWSPPWVADAAAVVRRASPDVVVNTGDFLWREPPVERAVSVVAGFVLEKPDLAPHAVNLAILGNHDYYPANVTTQALAATLERAGVRVLTNAAACVRKGERGVSFVGLTDEEAGFEDGLALLEAAGRPRVALVHVPDLVEKMPKGAADLVLCGHTHGGQFTLPYLETWIVRKGCGSDYVAGMYRINGMPVYVNKGLGYTGLPIRFRARPEVTLVRLTR